MSSNVPEVRLELTETESTLKRLLLDVAQYASPKTPSELRFTGGWVRDKILGEDSHDIDVAINDKTGYQFGLLMEEYLKVPGNAAKYGIQVVEKDEDAAKDNKKMVMGLHKIAANPEKSKHLETVTTKVFGLDIDLVNLRKETYTEDSRNPQMEFGTPEEDALRRDATINALFYNLQTDLVEDFTKRGFQDKDDKLIRTPLEPYQTFKDDPLRILRLIRFAARLGWKIDSAAEKAMDNESIRAALRVKISRERVGVEVEKMLRGPRPLMALELIDKLGLFRTVFVDPTNDIDFEPDVSLWKKAYDCADTIFATDRYPTLKQLAAPDQDSEYLGWVLTAAVPWFDAPTPTVPEGKAPSPPVATAVIREGIKGTNKICKAVTAAVWNAREIQQYKDDYIKTSRSKSSPDGMLEKRGELGMAIRRWGATWASQVVLAAMIETAETTSPEQDVLVEYERFVAMVKALGLTTAYDDKPVIDGTSLAKALGVKPGPWMKDALDIVMQYQLANPDTAKAESAIDMVKDRKGELVNRLAGHFLQLTIRPMFSKTNSSQVTPQGRKAMGANPKRFEETEDAARPWKEMGRNGHVLPLLKWSISALNSSNVEAYWPLVVPPVLSLIDDTEVRYKVTGCDCLQMLMEATPSEFLRRTGLGPLFQDALGPSLSYLPSLTPGPESVQMLSAAYPALQAVGNTQFRQHANPSSAPDVPSADYIKFLGGVMHDHILPSCTHVADSYPDVLRVLLQQMAVVVQEMGINSVGELNQIIPALNGVLMNPFSAVNPSLELQTLSTLEITIKNCWPRMQIWKAEVLKGLCSCWLSTMAKVDDSSLSRNGEDIEQLRAKLKEVVELLKAACNDDKSEEETGQMIAVDSRLAGLFD